MFFICQLFVPVSEFVSRLLASSSSGEDENDHSNDEGGGGSDSSSSSSYVWVDTVGWDDAELRDDVTFKEILRFIGELVGR